MLIGTVWAAASNCASEVPTSRDSYVIKKSLTQSAEQRKLGSCFISAHLGRGGSADIAPGRLRRLQSILIDGESSTCNRSCVAASFEVRQRQCRRLEDGHCVVLALPHARRAGRRWPSSGKSLATTTAMSCFLYALARANRSSTWARGTRTNFIPRALPSLATASIALRASGQRGNSRGARLR
jgi:hypothetical protein